MAAFDIATPAGQQLAAVLNVALFPFVAVLSTKIESNIEFGFEMAGFFTTTQFTPATLVWETFRTLLVSSGRMQDFRAGVGVDPTLNTADAERLEQLELAVSIALSRRDMERRGRADMGLDVAGQAPDVDLQEAVAALNVFLRQHNLPEREFPDEAQPAVAAATAVTESLDDSSNDDIWTAVQPVRSSGESGRRAQSSEDGPALPGSPAGDDVTLMFRTGEGVRVMYTYPASLPASEVAARAARSLGVQDGNQLVVGRSAVDASEMRPISEFMMGRKQIPAHFAE